MRAEILAPQAVRGRLAAERLYSYHIPDALTSTIAVGHLVAIPFGEHTTAGIVWALDASDELTGSDMESPRQDHAHLRSLIRLLLPEPVLSEAQHALAEWIADYYATPLANAARLMLPPGLLSSLREVLLPVEPPPNDSPNLTSDAAMMLGLLHERGRLDRTQIRETLGVQRARAAITALVASGYASLTTEIPPSQREKRRERRVRLAGTPAQLAEWQQTARAALDERTGRQTQREKPIARRSRGEEREGERLLRQLAILEVIARPGLETPWRLEDLQRLTRATTTALRELQKAGLIEIDEVTVRHDPLAGRDIVQTAPLPLTPAQARALAAITASRTPEASHVFLLHGITGSGKTEIYLQALAEMTGARGARHRARPRNRAHATGDGALRWAFPWQGRAAA